ncbi:MAG: VanZ family protein [Lachnospiraceae bacterium]|nr:VanZ family protein [Ruminococcus sp.]MCM1274424.1 VanZ family protein [Lachnospiraceae bacterium]
MERIIYAYNLADAALCAFAAIILYIPIRLCFLKAHGKPRKPLLAEAAQMLLAGYIAALVNIVWFPVPRLFTEPEALFASFREGYYAGNSEVLRCLFVDFNPLLLLHDFEIRANIALFVPLGLLLPFAFRRLKWWQTDLICLGTTCLVELVQPLFGRAGDLDDVLMNALGGVIGCALAKLLLTIIRVKREVSYEK